MKRPDADFARYLPPKGESELWGLEVRAGGRITNAPGYSYPPRGHPSDHVFSWERGRILGAWQAILLIDGAGEFQARRRGAVETVEAGDLLWVTPGQWHRYRPSPQVGWAELWVELAGPVLGRLTEAGLLPAQNAVRRGLSTRVFAKLLGQMHEGLSNDDGADRAADGLRFLGLLMRREEGSESRLVCAVRSAERLLAERMPSAVCMPSLARELGVGYAGFRREFKRRTGLAPRQYFLRLRLERAQRLLGSTPAKLEDIAQQLGFSSGFHLSAAFKTHFGVAPAVWRKGGNSG